MNPLLVEALGSIVRHGLTIASGYLVTSGIWSGEEAAKYVTAAALALIGIGWGLYQKYASRLKLVTSMAMTQPMSEAKLDERIASGIVAPVSTPKTEVPRVVTP